MKTAGIISAICLMFSVSTEKTILDIEICNVRNHKGVILLSVYTDSRQYPYHPGKTYVVKKDSLSNSTLHTKIHDLLPGLYGIGLLDDENHNGRMENNMLGIPLEGFGFSNNPKLFLKRPDYERIVIKVSPGVNHIQLIVKY